MTEYRSKAKRLAERLRADIEAGNFDCFPRWPGELRLGELYGAARATVRKALAELIDAGLLVRRNSRLELVRLSEAAPVPAAAVRKTRRIAVVSSSFDQLMEGFFSGIAAAALVAGAECYCVESGGDPNLAWPEELLHPDRFDGMILMPLPYSPFYELYNCWRLAGKPVVFLDRLLDGVEGTLVEVDNAGGAYRAVTRLLTLYPRPVHCFSYPLGESSSVQERYLGFRNAMRDTGYGAAVDDYTLFFHFIDLYHQPELVGMSGVWRRLKTLTPPVSVFAVNDHAAYTVYVACRALGWEVGREVKLIGFDDSPMAYRLRPRLSSMRQPSFKVGRESFRMLERLMDGILSEPVCVKIPVELVEKESSLPGEPA